MIEILKYKAELARVVAARYEQEFRQEEVREQAKRLMESAERLNEQIAIQLEKEKELEAKIKELRQE